MTPVSELPSHETLADSDPLKDLYTDWSEIMVTTPGMTTRLLRSIFDELHQSTKEPEDVSYKEEAVGAVAGIWALPKDADTSRVLLYTHGGGFAVGSAASYRKVAGHVAKALGVTALSPTTVWLRRTRTLLAWKIASRSTKPYWNGASGLRTSRPSVIQPAGTWRLRPRWSFGTKDSRFLATSSFSLLGWIWRITVRLSSPTMPLMPCSRSHCCKAWLPESSATRWIRKTRWRIRCTPISRASPSYTSQLDRTKCSLTMPPG